MNSDWKKLSLGDVSLSIFSGGTPSTKVKEYWNGDIPWLSSGETRNRYIYSTEKSISKEGVINSSTKLAKKGSVVIASAGQGFTRGQVSMIKNDTYVNQSLIVIEPDDNVLDSYYLFFNLQSRYNQLRQISDGSSIRGSLTTKIIKKLDISLPDLSIQRKIGKVLYEIDTKIEVNKNINKNLESVAKTLFKYWLIDFIPFQKEEFKQSELGLIPNRWNIVELKDLVEIYNGYSYKGNELQESNDAMATIKNFNRNGEFKLDGLKKIIISDKVKDYHFLNLHDILVAHTDVTQNADIIGNAIMLLNKGDYDKIIMSMDLVKVIPKNNQMNKFLLFAILNNFRFKSHALGYVNGTTVLHLNKKAIPDYKIALPTDYSILEPISKNIENIYLKIAKNIKENQKLLKTGDILLPKLMSGEIDVSRVEI